MFARDVVLRRLLNSCHLHAQIRTSATTTHHVAQSAAGGRPRPKIDGRNRMSAFWAPIAKHGGSPDASNQGLLAKAAIMRQAHAGIFHMLPLGLRIQEKIEKLIDKHMASLGASKVSLSSISSEKLWQRSGRGRNDEFFHIKDRKSAKYLLSPTHEEEITALVAANVASYKDLPLRLYQISRKYRDERRPRQGLLRAREFLMKDLYTFDYDIDAALRTYDEVRRAYRAFFTEIGIPFVEASASSGNMGGDLSHEYHFTGSAGEDTIISCTRCDFAANEEVYQPPPFNAITAAESATQTTYGISSDRHTLYSIITPQSSPAVNMHLVKRLIPDLDASVEQPQALWSEHAERIQMYLIDPRCKRTVSDEQIIDNQRIILTKPAEGDRCPNCKGPLRIQSAIEVGHTFSLGTRYSEPFAAKVNDDIGSQAVAIQMGCHGVGVSRLIAAASDMLTDATGLNWPLAIAPFRAIIVALPLAELEGEAEGIYDMLTRSLQAQDIDFDLVIDDRQKSLGFKLSDADVVGYPFIIVLGKAFQPQGKVELQCRRLGLKTEVDVDALSDRIQTCTQELKMV